MGEYFGLPCQFCGHRRQEMWFGSNRDMFRCVDCGTVLCENCIDWKFTAVGSTIKGALAISTIGLSKIITGSVKKPKCMKCKSINVKAV